MNDGEVMDAYVDWLESFAWMWFATLTFRPIFSEHEAERRLLTWLEELRIALGTENFGYVAVPEYGIAGENFHYHVVIGGLREDCGAEERVDWMAQWHKLSGDAKIDAYVPGKGAVRYILKQLDPNDFDEILLSLSDLPRMQTQLGRSS